LIAGLAEFIELGAEGLADVRRNLLVFQHFLIFFNGGIFAKDAGFQDGMAVFARKGRFDVDPGAVDFAAGAGFFDARNFTADADDVIG
jgi:hypothetical protein